MRIFINRQVLSLRVYPQEIFAGFLVPFNQFSQYAINTTMIHTRNPPVNISLQIKACFRGQPKQVLPDLTAVLPATVVPFAAAEIVPSIEYQS